MNDGGLQYWQQGGQFEQENDMGRYAKDSGGGNFQQAPIGNHVGRCVHIVDLGTQHGEYQGQPTARQQVVITWELPDELMEDGLPFIVSAFFTNSLHEKAALRSALQNWRGKEFTPDELNGFDLTNVLGKPCMVSVVHTDKGKAKVSAVAAMPKGIKAKPAVNDSYAYWIEEHDPEVYDKIGPGLKKMIEASDEWKAMQKDLDKPPKLGGIPDMDDSIPF